MSRLADFWPRLPCDYPACLAPVLGAAYPPDWETWHYSGRITVAIPPPRFGWTSLTLVGSWGGPIVVLNLSHRYDPFEDLLNWLVAVAEGRLPVWCEVDQEGVKRRLLALPSPIDAGLIEFRVEGHAWSQRARREVWDCFLWLRLHRGQFVQEFSRRLHDWLAEDYRSDQWGRYGQDESQQALAVDPLPQLPGWSRLRDLAQALPKPPDDWL